MQPCFSGNLFALDRDMVMHSACVSKGNAYLQTGVDSSRQSMVTFVASLGAVFLAAVENVLNRKLTILIAYSVFSLL